MRPKSLGKGAAVAGLAVVIAYLLAGGLTLRISGQHVRPLFDSFGGIRPYQWSCPPKEFKANNTNPRQSKLPIALGPTGSVPISAVTDDGQALFSLAQDEIPPHAGDSQANATITPICASKLGAVPAGYSPAGNAYRFSLAYQSGAAITTVAKPGNVVVKPPSTADALAYSADGGKTWRLLKSFHSGTSIGASFTTPGIYLALVKGTGTGIVGGTSGGSGMSPWLIAVIVAVAAALIVGLVEVIRRRRT